MDPTLALLLQTSLIVAGPWVMMLLSRRLKTAFTSPIVLCFGLGIAVRNLTTLPLSESVAEQASGAAILLALPLLLFSSDILGWVRQSSKTVLGFSFVVIATMMATTVLSILMADRIPHIWMSGGMLTGILTGGTPNLFAVGYAFEAPEEIITITNSAEILCGALYLLYLLSLAPSLYSKLLPAYEDQLIVNEPHSPSIIAENKINCKDAGIGIGITLLIVAMSIGSSMALFGKLQDTFVIVAVTTLAVLASFSDRIHQLSGPFAVGDYLLLMFGVAVGMMSDFRVMIMEGGPYVLLVFLVIIVTIALHLLFCRLFAVDRDTAIITATAAYFGPVFIPQVAQVLKNKPLMVGGIATSLVGLAVGNYLGISTGLLIKYLLGL